MLSAVLVTQHGFSFAVAVAGVVAIVAGLVMIPLKISPPVWKDATSERMANERR